MWSNRGASEEPKIAGTCGASEIRIDASTAAAVIIRASLFMILTRGCICLGGLPFFCAEAAAISMIYTLPPQAISAFPRGTRALFLFRRSTACSLRIAYSKANVEGLAAFWARQSSLKGRLARGDGIRSSEAMHGSGCTLVGAMD